MAKQINKPAKSDATKGFFEIANANFNKDELLSYTITEMDDTVVHLKAGDVLVQRATIHNWVNNGTEPCVIAFVLISSEGETAVG